MRQDARKFMACRWVKAGFGVAKFRGQCLGELPTGAMIHEARDQGSIASSAFKNYICLNKCETAATRSGFPCALSP